MPASESLDLPREAFDFIDSIERLNDQSAVISCLDRELKKFGFTAWVVSGLPVPGELMQDKMLLNDWDPGWSKLYMENQYALKDPVAAFCFRSLHPFVWSDAPYDPELQPEAKEIMDGATEFRMRNGYSVPIHTPTGFQAVVSAGGEHLDLSPTAQRALHLMAIYAHAKAVAVVVPLVKAEIYVLTQREKDILSWTAAGKTAWEISRILGISQHTVKQHLKAAARKLDAPTKTSAVVSAIRRREIDL